jgi:glycosyltransferase involved in cell wall biosynthesis
MGNSNSGLKEKRPIIIQACRDLSFTGGGRVVLEVTRHLKERGWDVRIFTDYYDPKCLDFDVDVTTLPYGRLLHDWKISNRLSRILRHFVQLLYCTVFGTIALKRLAKNLGAFVINHNAEYLIGETVVAHNVFNEELKLQKISTKIAFIKYLNPVVLFRIVREKFVFGRVRNIIAVSKLTLGEVLPLTSSATKCRVINNGVNTEKFVPLSQSKRSLEREKLGFRDQDFVILFVGHEFKRKGLAILLDALAELPERAKAVVVGGRGDNLGSYQKLTDELGLRDRVRFLGTQVSVWEIYGGCDLFVLPSEYETFALVGLEALSCGIPILMPRIGGIPEYLSDGENGFFINYDSSELGCLISKLLDDMELYDRLKGCARSSARKHDWAIVADNYERFLIEALM